MAGLGGAISVAADAAARHLLAGDASRLELVTISARYGLIHSVALLVITLLLRRDERGTFWLKAAGWLFVLGIVLFAWMLDLVAAGAPPVLTKLVPWGGTAFIAGWVALLLAAVTPGKAR